MVTLPVIAAVTPVTSVAIGIGLLGETSRTGVTGAVAACLAVLAASVALACLARSAPHAEPHAEPRAESRAGSRTLGRTLSPGPACLASRARGSNDFTAHWRFAYGPIVACSPAHSRDDRP